MSSAPDEELRLCCRVALKAMIALGCAAVVLVGWDFLSSGLSGAGQDVVRIDLSDLAQGQVRTVGWRGRAVIVLHRRDDTVGALEQDGAAGRHPRWFVAFANGTARGCPLVWETARQQFRETCAGARYGAAGHPVGAPDLEPLRSPPHRWAGADVLVIGRGGG